MYEGAIRVPFMVQWKDHLPAGKTYQKPVSSMDIFATAAELAAAESPRQLEGVNLIPYLKGEDSSRPHETLFWRQGGKAAMRHGDWKLVRMGGKSRAGNAPWELYDLSTDISEADNLAKTHPAVLQQLIDRWETLNSKMSEPLF